RDVPNPSIGATEKDLVQYEPAPPRRWCSPNGLLSVRSSSASNVDFDCAYAHQLIDEVNRYSSWHLAYTGPDAPVVVAAGPFDPRDVNEALGILDHLLHIVESARDPLTHTITLKYTRDFEGGALIRRQGPIVSPDALPADGEEPQPPVASGTCRELSEGSETWIWCRNVPLQQGLEAFNKRGDWQFVAPALHRQRCVSYVHLARADDLLMYLVQEHLHVGSRNASVHQIVLVTDTKGEPGEPCNDHERGRRESEANGTTP
ncbi:MAG: hypothetical protein JWL65_140, partial [Gammaproteobacteria bacterium]|nr:hypothetical protein [Gammaproteobacteria bacterium]